MINDGIRTALLFLFLALFSGACASGDMTRAEIPKDAAVGPGVRAKQIARDFLIVDTHIDIPYRLSGKMEDISLSTNAGDFDYPRALEGGLNAPFMAIYVPAEHQVIGDAKEFADEMIDMVEGFQEKWPDKFVLARSVSDVREAFKEGLMALPMGMENGAPIEGRLENLEHFFNRGIRYITLTHSKANHICDSSYDSKRKWNGLSPFGRKLISEMNRLGIMIDISHVSDETFDQVLELSAAPVIASHSSCRAFTPDWERNMSDSMIRRLAENGGVIQIAVGSSFLKEEYRKRFSARARAKKAFLKRNALEDNHPSTAKWMEDYNRELDLLLADVTDVADHIDHVRGLVGINHVGLGSDFDGVGPTTPKGLKDVSQYPNLIQELLERGYSEVDVAKVLSGNLLRVWTKVEEVAVR
jgi:membrane dipeptidase